jgi:membrane AbrB-like protein
MKAGPRARALAGLALGAAGGWAFSRLGTPIPWMLGPMLTLAILRVSGVNVTALPGARQTGQWIIGTALGLYFTPQVMREVAGWWPLLVAGALFSIALGYGAGLALARLARIDTTTGIFASVPGGAAEMATLGERFGARVDLVAVAHSVRILIVTTVIPTAFALLHVHGADGYVPGMTAVSAGGWALLMASTAAGGFAAMALGVPNAFVLGSLAVAIPLTAAEIKLSAMPAVAAYAGQCLLGCALGSRFEPGFLRRAPRFVGSVALSVAGAIVLSAAFGWLVASLVGLRPGTLILGTAPGGIAEMCVTANVLHLGVPLVTAFQVARVVILLSCTSPVYSGLRAWRHWRTGSRE